MIFGWNRGLMEIVRQSKKRALVLYGAGFWGKISYQIFEIVGAAVTAFADDDNVKRGGSYCGLPVYSLQKCKELYADAVYVICVDEGKRGRENQRKERYAMKANLEALQLWDLDSEIHMSYYTFLLEANPLCYYEAEAFMHKETCYTLADVNNLIIFNHMGESGATYFDQLLDGHANIISIPGGVPGEAVYENRLKKLNGTELLIEIMAQMNGLFHGSLEKITYAERFLHGHMDSEGNQLSDNILIHAKDYLAYLVQLFDGDFTLHSYGHLLKILSAAYANCIGKKKMLEHDNWFFYHMHVFAPDFDALSKRFEKEFEKVVQLYLIREPIRRLYSLFSRLLHTEKANKDEFKKNRLQEWLLAGTGCYLKTITNEDKNIRVMRFEDLKRANKETMLLLCEWLGIPYDECLEKTTVNGALTYFTHYDEKGQKHFITGNDTSALQPRPMDDLFSHWDIARLELVYSKFKQAYGYGLEAPGFETLTESARNEIFQTEFKFGSAIREHMGIEMYETEDEFHYDVNAAIRQTFETFMTENQGEIMFYPCISPDLEK